MIASPEGRFRLLVLASHPIQYRAPLYRHLAAERWLDLAVWYGDDYGVRPTASPWGVADFRWDTDLLSGYAHTFLRNAAPRPSPSTRFGVWNPGLGRAVRRHAPRAIWLSGYATAHAWQCLTAAWTHRIPILYTSDTNALAEATGWRRTLKRAFLPPFYRRMAAFLVNGTTNDRHYESHAVPRSRRFFFPWAIENERIAAEADRARPERRRMRERWGVAENREAVLVVGRLSAEKDPRLVVESAARDPSLHVVTVGSGPLSGEIDRLAASRLPGRYTALGFVNQSEIPAIYAAGDLVVLASKREAWGLVVNEALASGCPVICSDRAGAAYDLLPPPMRFRAGDAEDLCRAVRSWREDREVRADPVRWARERVRRFSFAEDALGLRAACESLSSA